MEELEQKLLNEYIVLMAVAGWFITWVLQKVFPIINTNKYLRRWKPLFAPILCQGFVWIPGAVEADASIGEHILVGFWCGFLAAFGYQLAKRLLGARGVTLPDDPAQLGQASTAKTEDAKPSEESSESDDADDEEDKSDEKESSGRPTPKETPMPRRIEADAPPAPVSAPVPASTDAPTIVPQGSPIPVPAPVPAEPAAEPVPTSAEDKSEPPK